MKNLTKTFKNNLLSDDIIREISLSASKSIDEHLDEMDRKVGRNIGCKVRDQVNKITEVVFIETTWKTRQKISSP